MCFTPHIPQAEQTRVCRLLGEPAVGQALCVCQGLRVGEPSWRERTQQADKVLRAGREGAAGALGVEGEEREIPKPCLEPPGEAASALSSERRAEVCRQKRGPADSVSWRQRQRHGEVGTPARRRREGARLRLQPGPPVKPAASSRGCFSGGALRPEPGSRAPFGRTADELVGWLDREKGFLHVLLSS